MSGRWTGVLAAGLLIACWPWAARADGALIATSRISPQDRAAIQMRIDASRRAHPHVFDLVHAVRGHRPEVYRRFRGQRPNIMPELLALGPEAKWALIEAIAFRGMDRGPATIEEWNAVREGLLGALSALAPPEAAPVLRAIFEDPNADDLALRGAAVGLGRIGGPAERAALLRALQRKNRDRDAALWGLRYVRRIEVVRAVAPLLSHESQQTVKLAARALGYIGSSWAWRTGNAGAKQDELPIRDACARALLDAYLNREPDLQEPIARAFAMVDHPRGAAMIQEQLDGAKDGEARASLLALARRMTRSR